MGKFNSETAREAGRKSKRGPSKRLEPNIEEKMKLLYEDVLDDLLLNSKDLSPSEKIKLLSHLSSFILPKIKPTRDEFTMERIKEWENSKAFPSMDTPHPTE
jgi:hypothetical protein